MTRFLKAICTLTAAALLTVHGAAAEVPVPELSGPVVDQTGTLSAEEEGALEADLGAFEAEKGSQIAVLILASTAPETIEQYSLRVAEAWKIGRKKIDDGVVFIVALEDRAVRLEVGYGLEGAIPDAMAKRIIEDIVIPEFRSGTVYGGITAGVGAIEALIRGEPLPPPSAPASPEDLGVFFPLFLFGGIIMTYLLRPMLGQAGAAIVASGGAGILAAVLISFFAGFIVFIFILMASIPNGRMTSGGRGRRYRSGGFSSGGFSSGGRSFSGGGGSFGGGGASGRW